MAALPRVAVVDTGACNLRSVAKALARSGCQPLLCADAASLQSADALLLPGVSAFPSAARELKKTGLDRALRDAIASGRPYLGLCLGLQLLFDESNEHGGAMGLGLLPGVVRRLPERANGGANGGEALKLRVPHIGWNLVRWHGAHPLLEALPDEDTYYFVHSFCARPADASDQVGTTEHGEPFAAAVARDNMFAVQFHPEKSQAAGLRLLEAFAGWVRA